MKDQPKSKPARKRYTEGEYENGRYVTYLVTVLEDSPGHLTTRRLRLWQDGDYCVWPRQKNERPEIKNDGYDN